eukprot:m.290062 g.290062  ORF g.290062 m.290062 type:complete len:56 (+) comp16227_c5_seq1:2763-2930(+)
MRWTPRCDCPTSITTDSHRLSHQLSEIDPKLEWANGEHGKKGKRVTSTGPTQTQL